MLKENLESKWIDCFEKSFLLSGVNKDAGGDAANSTAGTQVSNIILDTTAQRGDVVEVMYYGDEYVFTAFSSINNGIQTS